MARPEELQKDISDSHKTAQENEDDWTSSSGSSSDDESEGDTEDAPEQSRIIVPPKVNQDLKGRLANFLPQISEANKQLQDPEVASKHNIDNIADGQGQYIEMNLGLGVLCEKPDDEVIQTHQSDSDASDSEPTIVTKEQSCNKTNFKKIEEI